MSDLSFNNSNRAKHFVNHSLDNLELLRGSFTTHKFKPHFHESYTIIFMDNGVGDYSSNRFNYIISTGSILVLNPFEVHTGQSVGNYPWNFMTMYVPQDLMKRAICSFGTDRELPFFKENTITDKSLFIKGKEVFLNQIYERNYMEIEFSLMDFLKDLIQHYSSVNENGISNSKEFPIAKEIRDFLHDNYLSDVSLTQLSKMCELPEYHLVKTFKKHFQLPPHQYLINLRIEKAKQLLSLKYSSTEVAFRSGFFDQSHFIRQFKRIVGITPKQFASASL